MKKKALSLTLGLSATALAAILVLPVIAQESLLPEGFGNPADTPTPKSSPTPSPSPTATPAPGSAPADGVAPPTVAPTLDSATIGAADEEGEQAEDVESGGLKYDLPLTGGGVLCP